MIARMTKWDEEEFCRLISYHKSDRFQGIKRVVDGETVAMVGLDDWTENSVEAHIWLRDPHGFSKLFIREVFRHIFVVCKRGLVIVVIPCNNVASLEMNQRLGFRVNTYIKDGYAVGTDLAILELRREDCRWLGASSGK